MNDDPAALTLAWAGSAGEQQLTLGAAAGEVEATLSESSEPALPVPAGTALRLERTSSGLWWASAQGPGVGEWLADGSSLRCSQALDHGSVLDLGELRLAVFLGGDLAEGTPVTAGKQRPLNDGAADSGYPTLDVDPPDLDVAAQRSDEVPDTLPELPVLRPGEGDARPTGAAQSEGAAGLPAQVEGTPSAGQDERLLYNLSAPREELLRGDRFAPARPADEGKQPPASDAASPGAAAAPGAISAPPGNPSSKPEPAAPARFAVAAGGRPWVEDGVSRTPAQAFPRAPGPQDVWVLTLEHRHGAKTDEVVVLHPPTTASYLVVGRDPECAFPLTDAEVAPIQLGFQMQRDDVIVHRHPGTDLPVVIEGQVVTSPARLPMGGIVTFGRHALRVTSSRVMRAVDAPSHALVPRVVYRAAALTMVWRLERPGREPRTQHLKAQGDLGRPARLVIGSREPADWVLPGMLPDLERLELSAGRRRELLLHPVGGRVVLENEVVVDRTAIRRGQAVEVGGVRLTLLEVQAREASRPAWLPSASPLDRDVWVEAASCPDQDGRVLVLDLRAKHPAGKEERIRVDAPIGWGAACLRIGRDAECELVLHIPTVSRQHAAVRFTGGGLSIRDLSGRDSLWVNNRPVTKDTALVKGDTVTIGDARLDILGVTYREPSQPRARRRVRLTVALQVSGEEGPELYRVDRVIWSDRSAQLRLGAHPSSDVTIVGAPMSLGRLEVAQRGVVFVDGTGQGGRFYGGRAFERAVELVEGDAVEVGGVLVRFVGASVQELDG